MPEFTVRAFGETIHLPKRTKILDIIGDRDPDKRYVAALVDNRLRELTYEVYRDCRIDFIDCRDAEAVRIYEATLRYIVAMAFSHVYPGKRIRFSYNVSRCVSVNLCDEDMVASKEMMEKIQEEIACIVAQDLPLERIRVAKQEAAKLFEERGAKDKLDILPYTPEETVHLYRCGDYLDYMYRRLMPSTGYLHEYKMRLHGQGFLLQYPRAEEGGKIPPFEDAPTFNRTLDESHDWAKIIGSDSVAGVNHSIASRGEVDYINLSEARHNQMLSRLGEAIESRAGEIRLICIAGPSSSGKTTFANRLRIELLSRGLNPIRISIDDYYRDRDEMPIDEKGTPDYESIECLDIPRFNEDMLALIAGKEVQLPKFDFTLGHRVPGRKLQLKPNEPIIIEGIHALNDRLHNGIPKAQKFKIFISPQAQLNLDDHTPLSLTDLRLIRRIVRDYKFRASPAEETLHMWPSVRAGEFKWIYPYQEGCDFVYNSMLAYELPVMRKYALPLLQAIDVESDVYPAAQRLVHMLKFFVDMPDTWVPNNSLMREFIGGSCYADV